MAQGPRYRIGDGLSCFLESSRWIAALLVVLSHVKYLLFVDFSKAGQVNAAWKALYFLGGYGHEAVIVFFVLSGFLVGGLTQDKWATHGVDLVDYAIHRVARLYTVLIPALCIGLLLDTIGINWLNASELYTNSAKYHTISMSGVFADGMSLTTLLGNFAMLGGVTMPTLGSNTPLWSLANEWWYYCIFAAAWVVPHVRGRSRALAVALAVLMIVLLPLQLTLWGLNWLMGVAAFHLCKRFDGRLPRVVGIALLLGTLVYLRLAHNTDNAAHGETLMSNLLKDLGLAAVYAIAIVSMSGQRPAWRSASFHRRAAGASFTLYLVHFPMMIFIAAVVTERWGYRLVRVPDATGLAMYLGMIAFLCAWATLVAHLTEHRTAAVRQWLRGLLAKRFGLA